LVDELEREEAESVGRAEEEDAILRSEQQGGFLSEIERERNERERER